MYVDKESAIELLDENKIDVVAVISIINEVNDRVIFEIEFDDMPYVRFYDEVNDKMYSYPIKYEYCKQSPFDD